MTFRVHRSQVNVLIGENGAGKSTLMRILAGVETADEGALFLEGQPIALRSPRDAAANGISIVHQELLALTNLEDQRKHFCREGALSRGDCSWIEPEQDEAF